MTEENTNYISKITVDGVEYKIKDTEVRDCTSDVFRTAVIDLLYPVGSIKLTMTDSVPFGMTGKWTKIGTGCALVGVDPNGPFDNMKTANRQPFGYANSIVPSHTHTLPSHYHTGGYHSHTVNSHSHTIPSHTHAAGDLGVYYSIYWGTRSSEDVGEISGSTQVISQVKKGTGNWSGRSATVGSGTLTSNLTGGSTNERGITTDSASPAIQSSGESATNKNYQPSIAVYIWERTSA